MTEKIGRNEPCSCGSGKKFKKCCLGKKNFSMPNSSAISISAQERGKSERQILINRIKNSEFWDENEKIYIEPKGIAKMSEVLIDFAKPLLDLSPNEVKEQAIQIAIAVWNFSLLPKKEHNKIIEEMIDSLSDTTEKEKDRKISQYWIHMLLKRKKRHFSKDKRMVADFYISMSKNDFHLEVVSRIPNESIPNELRNELRQSSM